MLVVCYNKEFNNLINSRIFAIDQTYLKKNKQKLARETIEGKKSSKILSNQTFLENFN